MRNSVKFPLFSGENPLVWLEAMEDVFDDFQISWENQVEIAVCYLRGEADRWSKKNQQMILKNDWCAFSYHLLWEFEPTIEQPEPERIGYVEHEVGSFNALGWNVDKSAVMEDQMRSTEVDLHDRMVQYGLMSLDKMFDEMPDIDVGDSRFRTTQELHHMDNSNGIIISEPAMKGRIAPQYPNEGNFEKGIAATIDESASWQLAFALFSTKGILQEQCYNAEDDFNLAVWYNDTGWRMTEVCGTVWSAGLQEKSGYDLSVFQRHKQAKARCGTFEFMNSTPRIENRESGHIRSVSLSSVNSARFFFHSYRRVLDTNSPIYVDAALSQFLATNIIELRFDPADNPCSSAFGVFLVTFSARKGSKNVHTETRTCLELLELNILWNIVKEMLTQSFASTWLFSVSRLPIMHFQGVAIYYQLVISLLWDFRYYCIRFRIFNYHFGCIVVGHVSAPKGHMSDGVFQMMVLTFPFFVWNGLSCPLGRNWGALLFLNYIYVVASVICQKSLMARNFSQCTVQMQRCLWCHGSRYYLVWGISCFWSVIRIFLVAQCDLLRAGYLRHILKFVIPNSQVAAHLIPVLTWFHAKVVQLAITLRKVPALTNKIEQYHGSPVLSTNYGSAQSCGSLVEGSIVYMMLNNCGASSVELWCQQILITMPTTTSGVTVSLEKIIGSVAESVSNTAVGQLNLLSIDLHQQFRHLEAFKRGTCSTLSGIDSRCDVVIYFPGYIHFHLDESVSSVHRGTREEHHFISSTVGVHVIIITSSNKAMIQKYGSILFGALLTNVSGNSGRAYQRVVCGFHMVITCLQVVLEQMKSIKKKTRMTILVVDRAQSTSNAHTGKEVGLDHLRNTKLLEFIQNLISWRRQPQWILCLQVNILQLGTGGVSFRAHQSLGNIAFALNFRDWAYQVVGTAQNIATYLSSCVVITISFQHGSRILVTFHIPKFGGLFAWHLTYPILSCRPTKNRYSQGNVIHLQYACLVSREHRYHYAIRAQKILTVLVQFLGPYTASPF